MIKDFKLIKGQEAAKRAIDYECDEPIEED
jgi:hypothetical protein